MPDREAKECEFCGSRNVPESTCRDCGAPYPLDDIGKALRDYCQRRKRAELESLRSQLAAATERAAKAEAERDAILAWATKWVWRKVYIGADGKATYEFESSHKPIRADNPEAAIRKAAGLEGAE